MRCKTLVASVLLLISTAVLCAEDYKDDTGVVSKITDKKIEIVQSLYSAKKQKPTVYLINKNVNIQNANTIENILIGDTVKVLYEMVKNKKTAVMIELMGIN